jgi:ferrous iron transport protein A
MPSLDQAGIGQRFRIERIDGPPELVQRLLEFGLLDGEEVTVVGFAPLGDPIEIEVGSTRLSLRKHDAAGITVSPL